MINEIEFLYLTRKEVEATGVDMLLVMEAVEDSLKLYFQGKTNLPHKTVLDMDERERGRCNAMPAYVGGEYDVFGIKWIAGFPHNPLRHNLPRATGFIILNDSSELKTCYASFHKVAVAIRYDGYYIYGAPSMIGGYSGAAEGSALADIAGDLLQFPIMQAYISACQIYDVRFDSTCGRHALWAMSIACQALSHNTHTLQDKIINQCAGPCTEEILYTSAAGLVAAGVSGLPFTVGVRSAGGKYKNYLTPLEHWFGAEVFEASSKLSLEKANELVLYLLSKYEAGLKNQPKGKSFTECFEINTLTPNKEWQEIHDRVKADIEAHGLAVD